MKLRERNKSMQQNDQAAAKLLAEGRLTVDLEQGVVFATESKTPAKPVGTPNRRGYLRTCITTKGKAVTLMVHRIVWIAAHGVPPFGSQVNHKNGAKAENGISNLELATPAENNAHARETGLWQPVRGIQNGFAKLTDAQVAGARRLKGEGVRTAAIAERMGISEGYARRIVAGSARSSSPT